MLVIVGFFIVFGSIALGYWEAGGNFAVLFQPAEIIILAGAGFGALVVSSTMPGIKAVMRSVVFAFTGKGVHKEDYVELLQLMNDIFFKVTREGLLGIEKDVDAPAESAIFSKYPNFMKKDYALNFITDTLRTMTTATLSPHDLDPLLDAELEKHREDLLAPAKAINHMAEAFPGLGIVAAVLGIVVTMGKIDGPPAELGKSIGAALVGTLMGVLLCYGAVGPVARKIEHLVEEEMLFLMVIKVILVGFVGGLNPRIAIDFGRRLIVSEERPSFVELEADVFKRRTKT